MSATQPTATATPIYRFSLASWLSIYGRTCLMDFVKETDYATLERELSSAQAELTALRAEVAELREDKARLETHPRIASLVSSPTAGHYTVMQRGTSIVLQDFLKSPAAAEAWCMANGWTLFPSPAIKQLVDACRAALDETANYSGLSDDSEPVLSFETRKILYAALKAAKAAKLFP